MEGRKIDHEQGEPDEESTVRKFRTVQIEGKREVTRNVVHYNLDMIISLGYRVRSEIYSFTLIRLLVYGRLPERTSS